MELILGLGITIGLMLVAWSIYYKDKNPGIVDVFWGLSILSAGSFYLVYPIWQADFTIPLALLVVWGLRLSLFLFLTRFAKKIVEKRYDQLSHKWQNKTLGFLYHFLFQAILAWLIAIPFYFISHQNFSSPVVFIGYLLVILGVIGESLADKALYTHRQKHKKAVCEVGLWKYSRHPNYFCECVIWLGFSVMGYSGGISIISFLSVITLFCIMWFATIPITEKQSIESRGEAFIAYQKRVSCFFPWIRKEDA